MLPYIVPCAVLLAGVPLAAAQTSPSATPGEIPAATYQLIPRLSQASYAVDEVFIRENFRLFTAVGVTPGVAGEIIFNRDRPLESRVQEIVIDLQQLTSDSDRRDRALRERYLESNRYPFARLSNAQLGGLPETIVERTPFRFSLVGDLTAHDVTRRTTWEGEATLAGDTLQGIARTQVTMSSFGIDVPRLPFVRAEDGVKLEIRYVAVLRKP
jgi:polyisoprenoid-binding protein YceI